MSSTDPVSSIINCYRLIWTQYTASSSRNAQLSQLDLVFHCSPGYWICQLKDTPYNYFFGPAQSYIANTLDTTSFVPPSTCSRYCQLGSTTKHQEKTLGRDAKLPPYCEDFKRKPWTYCDSRKFQVLHVCLVSLSQHSFCIVPLTTKLFIFLEGPAR